MINQNDNDKRKEKTPGITEDPKGPAIDPRERHDPLHAPTTPDADPTRTPNPLSEPDVSIKDPKHRDGTPTEVETPPEDR
jgi:hypothetical protein